MENEKQQIDFIEFLEIEKKLEIKYGRISSVEDVPKSSKLIKLVVDFGNGDIRTVVTNIKSKLSEPASLVGQGSFFITNLKPANMMGIESQAMILPAEYQGSFLWPNSITGAKLI
jgi:methionyl-tRNA synthetase